MVAVESGIGFPADRTKYAGIEPQFWVPRFNSSPIGTLFIKKNMS